jgi:hypothetical protein
MPTATSAATAVVTAGSGSVGPPPSDDALWQFVVYDRENNALADVSTIATNKKVSRRLSRPSSCTFTVPANHALVNTLHSDGQPIVAPGIRCVKVRYRPSASSDWTLWFNGLIWLVQDEGTEDMAYTSVTAFDPLMWFKFRWVRDQTGDFSTPTFYGQGSDPDAISGPDLIRQMVNNTVWNWSDNPGDYEGEFGLDSLTGTFDIESPPAWDMRGNLSNWPILMSDMFHLVTEAGGCDAWVDPVDDNDGYGTRIMGVLNAVNKAGTTSIVHFDYGMGDYSIRQIRRSLDIEGLCNKLWYYLGPPENVIDYATSEILIRRWKGNIQGDAFDSAPPTGPPTYSKDSGLPAEIAASRAAYDTAMDVRIYEDAEDENSNRPLFWHLWHTENRMRNQPREMLFVTPVRGAPFDVSSIVLGDIITINASDVLRQGFSAQQRVYGFDVEISDENVSSITELVCSADAE